MTILRLSKLMAIKMINRLSCHINRMEMVWLLTSEPHQSPCWMYAHNILYAFLSRERSLLRRLSLHHTGEICQVGAAVIP